MRILVTGSTGFLGDALTEQLCKTLWVERVYALYRNPSKIELLAGHLEPYAGKLVSVRSDDKSIFKATDKIDTVIHCAAVRNIKYCQENPREAYLGNVVFTQKLLEESQKAGVKRFIYISSQSIYGYGREEVTEDDPVSPQNIYAKTKYTGELLTETLYRDESYIILRPSRLYGRGLFMNTDSLISGLFPRFCREGKPLTIHGDGTQTINIIHTRDVAQAVLSLIESSDNVWNSVYNVADEKAVSLNDIAQCFVSWGKSTGKKVDVKYTGSSNKVLKIPDLSIKKITDAINWKPEMDMQEAVEEMMDEAAG